MPSALAALSIPLKGVKWHWRMHFNWFSWVSFTIRFAIDGAKEQNKSLKRKIYNMTKRSDFNRTRKTLLSRICFHNNWRDNIIYSDDFLTWWFLQSFTCIVWKTALVLFSNTRACPWWMKFFDGWNFSMTPTVHLTDIFKL